MSIAVSLYAGILLALPVMLLHDWLLIGDPLYFAAVSARFSAAVPDVIAGQTPSYMAGWVTRFILGFGAVTALAILGLVLLIRQRQNRLVLGLLALGPGVGSFLVFLTVRGTYVSTRYAMPIELAILFLAGVGFGALRVPWLVAWVRDLMRHRPAWRSNVGIAVPVAASIPNRMWALAESSRPPAATTRPPSTARDET